MCDHGSTVSVSCMPGGERPDSGVAQRLLKISVPVVLPCEANRVQLQQDIQRLKEHLKECNSMCCKSTLGVNHEICNYNPTSSELYKLGGVYISYLGSYIEIGGGSKGRVIYLDFFFCIFLT